MSHGELQNQLNVWFENITVFFKDIWIKIELTLKWLKKN